MKKVFLCLTVALLVISCSPEMNTGTVAGRNTKLPEWLAKAEGSGHYEVSLTDGTKKTGSFSIITGFDDFYTEFPMFTESEDSTIAGFFSKMDELGGIEYSITQSESKYVVKCMDFHDELLLPSGALMVEEGSYKAEFTRISDSEIKCEMEMKIIGTRIELDSKTVEEGEAKAYATLAK